LAEVAMDRSHCKTARAEVVGEFLSLPFRGAEDDRVAASLRLEDAGHDLSLVDRVRSVGVLLDALDELTVVLVGVDGPDVRRLVHVAARQSDHVTRHRRREEHGLPAGRSECNDALDIGQEAHVEHLVGFIEDQRLDGTKVQVLLLDEVEEASGSAYHDVDAGFQRLDLRLIGSAAVDRQNAGSAGLAGMPHLVGNLHGELTSGDDDESLWGSCRLEVGVDRVVRCSQLLEKWECESEGLARAGLRLADDVVAVEGHRKGEFLDGKCLGDAQVSQVGHRFGSDAEVSKCSQGVRLAVR
jgi:hypothetical protein